MFIAGYAKEEAQVHADMRLVCFAKCMPMQNEFMNNKGFFLQLKYMYMCEVTRKCM